MSSRTRTPLRARETYGKMTHARVKTNQWTAVPVSKWSAIILVFAGLSIFGVRGQALQKVLLFGAPLPGSGDVHRSTLQRKLLMDGLAPLAPVEDRAGFAIPENAAEPLEVFEGTLTLNNAGLTGKFSLLADIFTLVSNDASPWRHLPAFRIEFVQSGSHLIPAQQGLVITGSPVWNYIIGPGRVWQERADDGYTRAAFPFALIQRNQNCVHNGEMAFLFSNTRKPTISNVYYQITQETCYPMKFNMWGIVSATYTPGAVSNAQTIVRKQAEEFARRMPTKPLSELEKDFNKSGIDLTQFLAAYKHPGDVTAYGVVIDGTNYSAGCPTRFGEYAFCEEMRLPSYSIAKSAFAGVALMRLGALYGRGAYAELIKNYVPQYEEGGNWNATTFSNVSDMASGNYNLPGYEADEDSPAMDAFLVDEGYEAKLKDAFAIHNHFVAPGTKWIYQSSATFVLTQSMSAYFQRKQGPSADLFNMVRDDIYIPLHVSQGGLTTIRTDNSPAGSPSGYYGLFFIKDDVAKIGNFLNTRNGVVDGKQVLEPLRLQEALFRAPDPSAAGVSVEDGKSASLLGKPGFGQGPAVQGGRRYAHGFWGRYLSTEEFPQFSCNFWVAFMSGYGGNVVALLPNGATFYSFSDGNEFPWTGAVSELAKLASVCK
jgi:hypothetical protein